MLCEKPLGMNAKDAARVMKHAGKQHVMEAFMVRFHPQWLKARELIRSGRIGELKAVQVFFSYNNRDPKNIRNIPETGGGAILDIGGYGIVSGRFTFEAEPKRVVSLIDRDPNFKTDRLSSVIADFGEGRQLTFIVAHAARGASARDARRHQGADRDPDPLQRAAMGADDASSSTTARSSAARRRRRSRSRSSDQYAEEADAFALAVLGESALPYGAEDGVKKMKILDAMFKSEKTGKWVETGL